MMPSNADNPESYWGDSEDKSNLEDSDFSKIKEKSFRNSKNRFLCLTIGGRYLKRIEEQHTYYRSILIKLLYTFTFVKSDTNTCIHRYVLKSEMLYIKLLIVNVSGWMVVCLYLLKFSTMSSNFRVRKEKLLLLKQ